MDLLARREHARYELMQKLQCHAPQEIINVVLDELASEQLLSDERFAGMIVRNCGNRGYGPLYIRQKLAQQQVSAMIISHVLDDTCEFDWQVQADRQRIKHFGPLVPEDKKTLLRQMQYLQRRGFSSEHILGIFNCR